VLVGDGVYLARKGMLEEFCGMANVLEDDLRTRGIEDADPGVRLLGRREIDDLLESDEVKGSL
jgi:sulfur transfer complex TusBCD TusB component (DsrH family)